MLFVVALANLLVNVLLFSINVKHKIAIRELKIKNYYFRGLERDMNILDKSDI